MKYNLLVELKSRGLPNDVVKYLYELLKRFVKRPGIIEYTFIPEVGELQLFANLFPLTVDCSIPLDENLKLSQTEYTIVLNSREDIIYIDDKRIEIGINSEYGYFAKSIYRDPEKPTIKFQYYDPSALEFLYDKEYNINSTSFEKYGIVPNFVHVESADKSLNEARKSVEYALCYLINPEVLKEEIQTRRKIRKL